MAVLGAPAAADHARAAGRADGLGPGPRHAHHDARQAGVPRAPGDLELHRRQPAAVPTAVRAARRVHRQPVPGRGERLAVEPAGRGARLHADRPAGPADHVQPLPVRHGRLRAGHGRAAAADGDRSARAAAGAAAGADVPAAAVPRHVRGGRGDLPLPRPAAAVVVRRAAVRRRGLRVLLVGDGGDRADLHPAVPGDRDRPPAAAPDLAAELAHRRQLRRVPLRLRRPAGAAVPRPAHAVARRPDRGADRARVRAGLLARRGEAGDEAAPRAHPPPRTHPDPERAAGAAATEPPTEELAPVSAPHPASARS